MMEGYRTVVRMRPKTVEIRAGSGAVATAAIAFCELLLGCAAIGYGLGIRAYWLVGVGAAAALLAFLLFWKTGVVAPGTLLFCADETGIRIDPAVGSGAVIEGYESLSLAEREGNYLLLHPADTEEYLSSLNQKSRCIAGAWIEKAGAPLAVNLVNLERLSDKKLEADQFSGCLADRILYHQLLKLEETKRFSTASRLENDLTLLIAGEEAKVGSEGVLLRVQGQRGVWLCPFSSMLAVSSLQSKENGVAELLLLLIFSGVVVVFCDSDEAFLEIYDRVFALEGFDQQAFFRSSHSGDGKPVVCWKKK